MAESNVCIRQQGSAPGLERFEAAVAGRGFAPHRHDCYAVGLTLSGVQRFRYRGSAWAGLSGQVHVLHPDELHDGGLVRYRCRVGHAFSPDSLLAEQSQSLEAALWVALRALEESSSLARRVAERARDRNQNLSALRFDERASEADRSASLIREVLLGGKDLVVESEPEGVDGDQDARSADN